MRGPAEVAEGTARAVGAGSGAVLALVRAAVSLGSAVLCRAGWSAVRRQGEERGVRRGGELLCQGSLGNPGNPGKLGSQGKLEGEVQAETDPREVSYFYDRYYFSEQ